MRPKTRYARSGDVNIASDFQAGGRSTPVWAAELAARHLAIWRDYSGLPSRRYPGSV